MGDFCEPPSSTLYTLVSVMPDGLEIQVMIIYNASVSKEIFFFGFGLWTDRVSNLESENVLCLLIICCVVL